MSKGRTQEAGEAHGPHNEGVHKPNPPPASPHTLSSRVWESGAPILSSILSRPPMMSPPTLSSRGWGVRGASSRQWPPWAANALKTPMYVAPHLADGPHGQQTYKAASLNDEPTHAFSRVWEVRGASSRQWPHGLQTHCQLHCTWRLISPTAPMGNKRTKYEAPPSKGQNRGEAKGLQPNKIDGGRESNPRA